MEPQTDVAAALRSYFATGATRDVAWRTAQLEGLRRMLTERLDDLTRALADDLGKSSRESWLTDIGFVVQEIDHALRHLTAWLRPRWSAVPLALQPAHAESVLVPKGAALIISPWNYPVNLTLTPLIGALAAGDVAVIKPSELAPATAAVLAHYVPDYLDTRAVRVVLGGPDVVTSLLEQQWDHIFYTGSSRVGRIVARAAAEQLAPVTLELGGKSPAFVDGTVDLTVAARRLAWAKFTNAGQTCVAPDYLITTPLVQPDLIAALGSAITEMYGADPRLSESYGRIVSTQHFQRLIGLLPAPDKITVGGGHDADERYLAPTVVADADPEGELMAEEVFGPILPIITAATPAQAVDFIRARPHPLTIYVFSEDAQVRDLFAAETLSGALVFNTAAVHLSAPELPFGGVGNSGYGAYHGNHSIETFSHRRSILSKPLHPDTEKIIYPPFNAAKDWTIDHLVSPGRAADPGSEPHSGG